MDEAIMAIIFQYASYELIASRKARRPEMERSASGQRTYDIRVQLKLNDKTPSGSSAAQGARVDNILQRQSFSIGCES